MSSQQESNPKRFQGRNELNYSTKPMIFRCFFFQMAAQMPMVMQQMQDPRFQQLLTNPRAMQAMMQVQQGMQNLQSEVPGFLSGPGLIPTPPTTTTGTSSTTNPPAPSTTTSSTGGTNTTPGLPCSESLTNTATMSMRKQNSLIPY